MFYSEFTSRFLMMISQEEQEKLKNARVLVFGVGGVGGSVAHMLVRSGVKHIGIVDFDTIALTNINRQIIANSTNIGKLKVDELESQLKDINPELEVIKYPIQLSQETINQIDFFNYTYIIDCIDDVSAKKLLIKNSYELNIPILCAMGAGNRYKEIPAFEISTIEKTSYDPIAKILRKFCAQEGIKNLQVCYTKQKALKFDCKTIGSVVYYTLNMASVICAKAINDILER